MLLTNAIAQTLKNNKHLKLIKKLPVCWAGCTFFGAKGNYLLFRAFNLPFYSLIF